MVTDQRVNKRSLILPMVLPNTPTRSDNNIIEPNGAKPLGRVATAKKFSREIWNDHQFWLNTVAMKSGAGAIVLAGTLGIGYVVSLPFLAATTGLIVCSGIIGFGVFGIAAGAVRAKNHLRSTYYKATGKEEPPHAPENNKSMTQRLREKPMVQKILAHKFTQKMKDTLAWRMVSKLHHRQEAMLGGLAGVGSVTSVALGGWMLFTALVALPVITAGSLLTIAAVTGLAYLASGISSTYLTVRGLMDSREKKKEAAALAAANVAAQIDVQNVAPFDSSVPAITKDFTAANNDTPLSGVSNVSGQKTVNAPCQPPKK